MIAIVTTLISLAAFAVAWFSLIINEEKFRLDLYNKRFDIYLRTVKFYQALMRLQESKEAGIFDALQVGFIIATRESKFLFAPNSGVYDLLSRLNTASFTITGLRDLPKGLPPEQIIQNQEQISGALMLWNSSMEHLEDLMAPYLNYHYTSALSAFMGRARGLLHSPSRSR